MKLSQPVLRLAILAVVTLFFAVPTPLLRRQLCPQLVGLGIDNLQFYGMNDAGVVVLYSNSSCGNPATGCYETFLNGVSTGNTDIAPAYTWDNGTPCSPALPPGGSLLHGVCNNGRDAFTGFLTSGQVKAGVYTGLNTSLFDNGGYGSIFMNNQGNIVFDEEVGDEWYEALDLTTAAPEPGSLVFLATGIASLATILTLRRRRLSQA